MGVDGPGADENDRRPDDRALWAQAAVVAQMLPLFEHNPAVIGETLILLKLATRFTRFARYRDRHGQPYQRAGRHRCWTIKHPRKGQPQPVVLLDTGLIVHVDPPEGIDRPDGLTYLSRTPLRRWDPKDEDTFPAEVLPADDLLRASLEGALERYEAFGE